MTILDEMIIPLRAEEQLARSWLDSARREGHRRRFPRADSFSVGAVGRFTAIQGAVHGDLDKHPGSYVMDITRRTGLRKNQVEYALLVLKAKGEVQNVRDNQKGIAVRHRWWIAKKS